MLEVIVLGSGSRGNATLVRGPGSALLIDAGLSARQLCRRLEQVGQDPRGLEGVLLTHEHSDHVAGLRVFRRKTPVPVFANRATLDAAREAIDDGIDGAVELPAGSEIRIGAFEVSSFRVPHDAADPVGYRVAAGGVCLGYATDLGHVTHLVRQRLLGCQLLVLEANHDRQMLLDGPYPWPTKQRVASRHGHLSNDHAATLLPEVIDPETRAVVLAHLSETNNDPLLARATVGGMLAQEGKGHVRLELARQHEPSPPMAV